MLLIGILSGDLTLDLSYDCLQAHHTFCLDQIWVWINWWPSVKNTWSLNLTTWQIDSHFVWEEIGTISNTISVRFFSKGSSSMIYKKNQNWNYLRSMWKASALCFWADLLGKFGSAESFFRHLAGSNGWSSSQDWPEKNRNINMNIYL